MAIIDTTAPEAKSLHHGNIHTLILSKYSNGDATGGSFTFSYAASSTLAKLFHNKYFYTLKYLNVYNSDTTNNNLITLYLPNSPFSLNLSVAEFYLIANPTALSEKHTNIPLGYLESQGSGQLQILYPQNNNNENYTWNAIFEGILT